MRCAWLRARVALASLAAAAVVALIGARPSAAQGNRESVFQTIYKNKVWEPWGCPSGWSNPKDVKGAMYVLELVVHKYELKSMLDMPCGDMCYMPLVLDQIWMRNPSFDYTGVDIVPTVIEEHQQKFAPLGAKMSFMQMDAVKTPQLPPVELVYSRWMMNHLCEDDVVKILSKVHKSGAKYALMTHTDLEGEAHATHPMSCDYAMLTQKVTDVGAMAVQTTLYDLTKGPFALPKPIHVYSEMHSSGDKLYTLGLWKLPFEGWGVDGPISAGRGKVESLSAAALG